MHSIIYFFAFWALTAASLSSLKYPKRVLVVGGSGRVGFSAARSLFDNGVSDITIGGRNVANFDREINRCDRDDIRDGFSFQEIDIFSKDIDALTAIIDEYDLVLNTAGPFQQLENNPLLELCLSRPNMQYLDVCDDITLSRIVRGSKYQQLAQQYKSTAIISAGIWPGGSSLLGKQLIDQSGGAINVKDVKFHFFTAGSGNAGATIITATFLILGEDVLVYKDGVEVYRKTATDTINVDFGKDIGVRDIARLNLIEAESCYQYSGIGNIETKFGTAPPFWNKLFGIMATVMPQSLLQDRKKMAWLANFSLPMIRLIDTFVGSKNSILIEVTTNEGNVNKAVMTHADLEKAVGDGLAAFAIQMLQDGKVKPGAVYFPEEVKEGEGVEEGSFGREILAFLAEDALNYEVTIN